MLVAGDAARATRLIGFVCEQPEGLCEGKVTDDANEAVAVPCAGRLLR